MNTASITLLKTGVIDISLSAMAKANMLGYDNDGIYEVHVNTMERFWSLLRSWLRPHRGFLRKVYPYTLASLSSFITAETGAKGYFNIN